MEVKAHAKWPAAQNVHVIGHVSYRDVRSYDIRHIGHHLASDPESTTAYGVTLTDCTAIEPVFNSLYKDLSPRALVISAYKNVVVSGFTAIGDPSYDYKIIPLSHCNIAAETSHSMEFKCVGLRKLKRISVFWWQPAD